MDCLSRQGLKPLYRYLFVWREAGTVPSCLVSRSNESLYSGLVQNCRICKTGINLSVVNSGLIPQDQFLTPVSLQCNLHSKSHRTLCQLGVNREMWAICGVCSNLNTWNA